MPLDVEKLVVSWWVCYNDKFYYCLSFGIDVVLTIRDEYSMNTDPIEKKGSLIIVRDSKSIVKDVPI